METLKYKCLLFISCFTAISSGQCSFQYISNDTVFQDYIELVYSRKSADEIITIGSHINRGIINDTIFNAPVFQSFDYCGNILNKIFYEYIVGYKLKHVPIPTHNTYQDEPVGNTAIKIKDDEFLLVDKATDTLSNASVMILFKINENGGLKFYNTLNLDAHEVNNTTIKNVLELKDGKILVILWDYIDNYYFYYFDINLNYLSKKSVFLERGLRAIKEVDNGEFIGTSLAYDKSSFQFYRFDTSGKINWMVTPPYNALGSAREILIENNKIYIIGGVSYGSNGVFGVFLFCDMDGGNLKEFRYDTFFCQTRFCSAYLDNDNTLLIGGYIQHCQSNDSSGTDVAILKIDSIGTILWNKLYDFRNFLGTSGPQGKYNDYGGFVITKANDGGAITNGISRYSRLTPGGVLHEDALLIKTESIIVTNTKKESNIGNLKYELVANPTNSNLTIRGPVDLIKNWVIYSLSGEIMLHGEKWFGSVNVRNINAGIYALKILNQNNYQYFYKFVKI